MYIKRKRVIIPLIILVTLIIARLYLPTFLKNYINNTLSNIPGYYGHVKDIDVHLYKGTYVIHNLYLNKTGAKTDVPFLEFKKTDISLQWDALFKGKIVTQIELFQPKLIYVFENQQQKTEEDAETDDWTKALKNIVPIEINKLLVNDGVLAFVQITANPNIDLHIDQLHLEATNLRNVNQSSKKLPSTLKAQGNSIGNGKLTIEGKLDVLKKIPNMDLSVKLEDANIDSLNNLTNYYANIDFDSGKYAIFSELAIADGYMQGYIKPILSNLKLHTKGEDKFLETIWEGFVGLFKFILKNHKKETLATKVNFEGNLNDVNSSPFQTTLNVLKNAWIKAYQKTVDNSIDFKNTNEKTKNKK